MTQTIQFDYQPFERKTTLQLHSILSEKRNFDTEMAQRIDRLLETSMESVSENRNFETPMVLRIERLLETSRGSIPPPKIIPVEFLLTPPGTRNSALVNGYETIGNKRDMVRLVALVTLMVCVVLFALCVGLFAAGITFGGYLIVPMGASVIVGMLALGTLCFKYYKKI